MGIKLYLLVYFQMTHLVMWTWMPSVTQFTLLFKQLHLVVSTMIIIIIIISIIIIIIIIIII